MCLNWLRHFVKCHCAWPVYQPPDSSLLFIHNHPAVSFMRDYGRDLCLCVCMCVWFRKVDKGPDQNKAPTRIHPAPRSGPYCVYGVNDDGIYTYTKHTRVQASMSSGVRATEVIVAWEAWVSWRQTMLLCRMERWSNTGTEWEGGKGWGWRCKSLPAAVFH